MKTHRAIQVAALSAILAVVSVAAAPRNEPEGSPTAGTWSFGADLGISNSTGDDDFDAEPLVGGYFEYFPTDRLSWRGRLAMLDFDGPPLSPGAPGDVEILAVTGNALYHWRGGQVSPFMTAGLGFYDYDPQFGDPGDTELGLNGGGGMYLFLTPTVALEFEGLVHGTTEDRGPDSFVTGTASLRLEW